MSMAEGKKKFDELLNAALATSPTYQALVKNYRDELNSTRTHILDIRQDTLKSNISSSATQEEKNSFTLAYKEFIDTIKASGVTQYTYLKDLSLETNFDSIKQSTIFITRPAILISPTFSVTRRFITKISKLIKDNPYFGMSDRARTKSELVGEQYELFPIVRGLNEQEAKAVQETSITDASIVGWRVKSPSGNWRKNPRFFNKNGEEVVSLGSEVLKLRKLSVLDIGHLYGKGISALDTPITFKLENLLEVIPSADENLKKLVNNSLEQLSNLETRVTTSFINKIPEGMFKGPKSALVLTVELYHLNGKKAKVQTSIYNKIRAEIVKKITAEIPSIPGSNTVSEDITQTIQQIFINILKSTSAGPNLPKHATINTSVKGKSSGGRPSNTSESIVLSSKRSNKNTLSTKEVTQTTNLVSLQNILNQNLASQIQQNMGTGDRRDILNYRTGRFAESAKVERMSQSREGMITAFYSYMRNPYATFSTGGEQGFPASRDPKLLISKSIREIGATMVGNRMRAVLV